MGTSFAQSGTIKESTDLFTTVFQRNTKEILGRIVVFEEIWIHNYTPEMKEQ